MFGAKAQIAALEKGFDIERVMVPFDFTALYAPKHPEVLRVNPKMLEHKSDEVYFPHIIRLMGLEHDLQGEAALAAIAAANQYLAEMEAQLEGRDTWPAAIRLPTSPSTWPRCLANAKARRWAMKRRACWHGVSA